MKTIKDDMLSDAIETAFEFSKKIIILKRIVIVQCVIIAGLLVVIFCR